MGWLIGVALNLVGSIIINLGVNLMKMGHNRQALALGTTNASEQAKTKTRNPRKWLKRPGNTIWFIGICCFVLGNALNFFSFGFAAIGILSALTSVQFLSNVVFARFVNHEVITWRTILSTCVLATGCVILVAFGSHESPSFTSDELKALYASGYYIAYLIIAATVAVVSYLVYRIGKKRSGGDVAGATGPWAIWLPVCFASSGAIIGTQSVLYGKSLSLLFRSSLSGNAEWKNWYAYVTLLLFVGFAFYWVRRFNKGIRLFDVSLMIPVLQIFWVFFSMLAGSLYFQEFNAMNSLQLGMFGLGTLILLVGLYLLTTAQAAKMRQANESVKPVEDALEAQYQGYMDPAEIEYQSNEPMQLIVDKKKTSCSTEWLTCTTAPSTMEYELNNKENSYAQGGVKMDLVDNKGRVQRRGTIATPVKPIEKTIVRRVHSSPLVLCSCLVDTQF